MLGVLVQAQFKLSSTQLTVQEIQGEETGRAGAYSPSPFMVKSWPYSSITVVLYAKENTQDYTVHIYIL